MARTNQLRAAIEAHVATVGGGRRNPAGTLHASDDRAPRRRATYHIDASHRPATR